MEIVLRLRAAGAAGATALRGHWGYHGDHAPHGDLFWHLRRRAPVVTVVVDTPANIARWFEIVDELTQETGLVTSEMVREALERGRCPDMHTLLRLPFILLELALRRRCSAAAASDDARP